MAEFDSEQMEYARAFLRQYATPSAIEELIAGMGEPEAGFTDPSDQDADRVLEMLREVRAEMG